MKRIISLVGLLCCGLWSAVAEQPVTTLQHAGKTTLFYGNSSFVDAYNSASNGDTLMLSPGGFSVPAIQKGLVVIGSGHFPDSANVKRRTFLTNDMEIYKGSDGLYMEGIYLNNIHFNGKRENGDTIRNISFKRCRLEKINCNVKNSDGYGPYGDGFNLEECYIISDIQGTEYHFKMRNNVVFSNQSSIFSEKDAILENNIILHDDITGENGNVDNNIILYSRGEWAVSGDGMTGYNNMFLLGAKIYFSLENNYYAKDSSVFVKYSNSIDYEKNTEEIYKQDFHLKDPSKYIGTDGTQIGIYGGVHAAKEGAAPFNPQILSKSVAPKIDADGKLKISFKVAAQSE
jgi:hypothetical protein